METIQSTGSWPSTPAQPRPQPRPRGHPFTGQQASSDAHSRRGAHVLPPLPPSLAKPNPVQQEPSAADGDGCGADRGQERPCAGGCDRCAHRKPNLDVQRAISVPACATRDCAGEAGRRSWRSVALHMRMSSSGARSEGTGGSFDGLQNAQW